MITQPCITSLTLVATLALAACAPGPDPSVAETAVLHATRLDPPDPPPPICPDWMCNAATVGDGLVFDELVFDPPLTPNVQAPLFVSAAEMNGKPVRFTVRGNQVTVTPDGGTGIGKGIGGTTDVDGLIVEVSHRNGAAYQLRFEQTVLHKYWAGPSGEVPYHQIRVRKIRQGSEFGVMVGRVPDLDFQATLCAGTPDPREGQEVTAMAVLFEGDRYDNVNKTVQEVPSGSRWFNVACAGTAMLKMDLLRYTRASAATPLTVPQRQTLLKTLTADYCGGGRPYTVNGHPLIYTDALGRVPGVPLDIPGLLAKGATVEAIWGPDGAICLDVPRLVDRAQIDCSPRRDPPPCGDISDWKSRGGVLSLNPPPGL
jgi:hypothetical protein